MEKKKTFVYLPAVPQKVFVAPDCDSIDIIYLSLCWQSADANAFRGTACMYVCIEYKGGIC